MTEPKPAENYYINATNATDEWVRTMPQTTPPQSSLEERIDNLEALVLELFQRLQKLGIDA